MVNKMEMIRKLVRGNKWKMKMENDAIFEIWTPFKLTRKEAKILLLNFSNGEGDGFEGDNIYSNEDIVNFWETIK